MNRIITLCALLVTSIALNSQSIPSDRIIDWSDAGVEGGIPCWDTEIIMTDLVGDGTTDNLSVLQSYVDDYAGTYTKLIFESGTFLIDGKIQIPRDGKLMLVGQGASSTILSFNVEDIGSGGCFEIDAGGQSNEVSLSSGAEFGSTQITVSSSSGYAVGDWIEVDMENPGAITDVADWDVSWAERSLGQMFKVTAVNGNTLSLDRSFNHDYDEELDILVTEISPTEWVGFENFKLYVNNFGDNYNFQFKRSANCWVKLVESEMTARRHINLPISANISIVDNYIHDSWNHGNGGAGYGVAVDLHTTDCLIENNIFDRLRHSMMAKLGANGNVFAYNYSHNPYWTINDNTPSDGNQHGHLPHMNLFEGNIVGYIAADDVWGPAWSGTTYFRNRHYTDDRDVELNGPNENLNLLGNELLNGAVINNDPENIGTLMHGNIINGSVEWDSDYSQTLVNSYYLSEKPAWWGTDNWPSIGPEYPGGGGSIPAYERYHSSNLFPEHYCGNDRVESQVMCSEVFASSDDGNIPSNTLDDDLGTRWSAKGVGEYIEYCFDDTISLSSVSIAFYSGNVRSAYFDVLISLDGINWTVVLDNQTSSGITLEKETYEFTEVEAWKMRVVGNGNSSPSEWNSISEVSWNDVVTGIGSYSNEKISFFPNPFNDFIKVSNIKEVSLLEIKTVTGEVIYSEENFLNSKIELSGIQKKEGLVFIIVTFTDGDKEIFKLMKTY